MIIKENNSVASCEVLQFVILTSEIEKVRLTCLHKLWSIIAFELVADVEYHILC